MNLLAEQTKQLLLDETCLISGLSNVAAFLNEMLEDINWVGFYKLKQDDLALYPFQGKVACAHLKKPHGVCWASILNKTTQRVDDVHQFQGHIACDSASCSELVTLLYHGQEIWGVLDLDSPSFHRFSITDQNELEEVSQIISEFISRF